MIQELRRVVDHPSRPVHPARRGAKQPLRFRREDDLEVLVRRFTVVVAQERQKTNVSRGDRSFSPDPNL